MQRLGGDTDDSTKGMSPHNEKLSPAHETKILDDEPEIGNSVELDLFAPLTDVEAYNGGRILTFRALLTGAFLGSIITCSNLYLGEFALLPRTL